MNTAPPPGVTASPATSMYTFCPRTRNVVENDRICFPPGDSSSTSAASPEGIEPCCVRVALNT